MKDHVLLLLCAVTLAHSFTAETNQNARKCNCDPSEAQQICEANYGNHDVLIAHENCDKFYSCSNGKPVANRCPENLLYNPIEELCDWPQKVECGDRPISDGNDEDDSDCDDDVDSGPDDSVGGGDNNDGTCNCDPSEAPSICAAEGSNGILIAHEFCNQFYMCADGRPVSFVCGPNLLYNPYIQACDWPGNVECGDRVIPDPDDNDTGNDSGNEDNDDNGDGTCNCNPEEAPTICAAADSGGVLVAHENCNEFYICDAGKPVIVTCPGTLLYNPYTEKCDWPRDVDCGDRYVPEFNCTACNDSDEGDDTDLSPPSGDNEDIDARPPAGDDAGNDNEDIEARPPAGDDAGNDNEDIDARPPSGDDAGNDNEDIDARPPAGDDAGNDNEDIDARPPAGDDAGNDNEDIDARPPAGDDAGNDNDNEGNDNIGAGNSDPSEAPTICAADDSDSILVAHENCNEFYICNGGKPVAVQCPGKLLFNPDKDQCDWPHNVDCGDRVVPDVEDDSTSNPGSGNDNEDSGTVRPPDGDGGNDNEDSGTVRPPGGDGGNDNDNGGNDNDNGGNDNIGAGNSDPSEAPTICAADDSDSILVAHENCNEFYICSGGKPVAVQCPGKLLFNPDKDQCDWPHNVDCGDRVVPDVEDDSTSNPGSGNDNEDSGTVRPPGGDGGNDNEDSGTVRPPGGDGGNDNDNGGNDNDNGGNDNIGAGNCDPSEAPTICAADDSDSILVAHENCNEFYICSGGKPVAVQCPGKLLFNPDKDQCDWPHNVDCGDRVVPDVEDDSTSNPGSGNDNEDSGTVRPPGGDGGNDNEDSGTVRPPGGDGGNDNDNGGNDNDNGGNDNIGAGNSDPSEAPTICAADDSDSILVAHENCNEFYICSGGKPVAVQCPGKLLFNPDKDQCDWPHNVDCGDRVVPDVEDDSTSNPGSGNDNEDSGTVRPPGGDGGNDNEDSGTVRPPGGDGGNDNDNGGNDNDNGGNDNIGAGNSDPSEAPTICAADDSDSILVAHENCNEFYICNGGKPVAVQCPGKLLFNPDKDQCDWPHNVDCGDRVVPDVEDDSTSNPGSGNDNEDSGTVRPPGGDGGNDNEDSGTVRPPGGDGGNDNDNGGNDNDNGGNDNIGAGNSDPSEAPTICAADDSDSILVAHENCNEFYICSGGKPVAVQCPGKLLFNPDKDQCDWPHNVDCGDRVVPDVEDDSTSNPGSGNDNEDSGTVRPPGGDGGNDNEDSGTVRPPGGDGGNDTEDIDARPPAGDDSGNDNEDIDARPPAGDDAGNDSDNIEASTPGCDDEDGNGSDNDNVSDCNCQPDEASSICAVDDSDGVMVAHNYCNHFFKCSNGKPVVFKCPSGLLYNPHTEKCDWPFNVECGDRVIPDPEDDIDGESEEVEDGGNENNNGTCNCNPEEAPAICAAGGSDGQMIAHEHCNRFYQCNAGRPVAITCPTNLLYNPYKEVCDWPENVECGERVIPEPDEDADDNDTDENDADDNDGIINDDPSQAPSICADSASNGVLVAHENCNKFYMCSGGSPVVLSCAGELLYNPITQECDWPRNVDCGDRIVPESDDDCACNPRNAPALCSRPNSNGRLIAHENCNQFYVCEGGVPQAFFCAANLYYNPDNEACDWPQNVDCNSRMITYSSLNKHYESRQTLRN